MEAVAVEVHGDDVAVVAEAEVAEHEVVAVEVGVAAVEAVVEAEVEAVVAAVEHLHLVVVLVEQNVAFVGVGADLPHPSVQHEGP